MENNMYTMNPLEVKKKKEEWIRIERIVYEPIC